MPVIRMLSAATLLFVVAVGPAGLGACADEEFTCCLCSYDGPGCSSTSCTCSQEPEYTEDDCSSYCASHLDCGANEAKSASAKDSC